MKTAGMATMGGAAVIFLIALLLLTAGHFSLLWVILLILSPFVFILGVPFATGSGPEYLLSCAWPYAGFPPASRVASRGLCTGIMKGGVLCAPHAQKIPTIASRESTRRAPAVSRGA